MASADLDLKLTQIQLRQLINELATSAQEAAAGGTLPSAYDVGVYQISVGSAWVDVLSAAFDSITVAGKVTALSPMLTMDIYNSHASQTLYILLRANDGEATTAAIPLVAGSAITIPCSLAARGDAIAAVSFYGAGADTTGYIVANFGSV